MSNHRDHSKQRRNDNVLKSLPAEVFLKARSTLVSIGGALKSKQEHQSRSKLPKQDTKDKKNHDKLKNSRSEPEFNEVRKRHRSRIDDNTGREYSSGVRPRPLSLGASKRYDKDIESFQCENFVRDASSPVHQRQFDSSEEVCVQSRLVIPVIERLSNPDIQMQDASERPRKKLSFREPCEIVGGGSATLGRSNKLMGVNSLTKRPNRVSLRSDTHFASLDGLDSDLESQAMKIVRTVGQAFEVCHKMQTNNPEQPEPSTSSAIDEAAPSDRGSDVPPSKEAVSDCGASESGAASTSKAVVEEGAVGGRVDAVRPKNLDLLPPPPRKESKRSSQRTIPTPSINLPDLPECVTKVDITPVDNAANATTPLSAQHQLQLLRERLEQQAQQTRAAVAQLLLLRDQLAAEQAARCEAQARTHQLLVQNKDLLEHIAALVAHLQEREKGSSRPINAQQLTLLPQILHDGGFKDIKPEACNGNRQQVNDDALINLFTQNSKINQNVENNNFSFSPFRVSPTPELKNGASSAPSFGAMTNDQIQDYLASKFQDMGGSPKEEPKRAYYEQQYYQNSKAFPNIPPLTNHFSSTDLANLINHTAYNSVFSTEELTAAAQAMSLGQSQNSLFSNSQGTTSKDSSPDEFSSDDSIPFIMPLSHNGTLTATGDDGRVRLIVPVSPSESTLNVAAEVHPEPQTSGHNLKVPGSDCLLAPAAPITRTTSEKVPNRSEMMTALRAQWTRHTTK